MKKAAIAIGSNSTRLLAVCGDKQLKLRAETKLMLSTGDTGLISEEGMIKTAQAVRELAAQARQFGADDVRLYATSATRDAGNSADFIDLLREVTGLQLHIISGPDEARLAFEAASGGKNCAVLDIGGGSTEVSFGENNTVSIARSARVGASRLLKQIGPITSIEEAQKGIEAADLIMRDALQELLSLPFPPELIAIGGTSTTLAAILNKTDSHGDELDQSTATLAQAEQLLYDLAPMSDAQRAEIPGLYASRVQIMPHGLCILCAAMRMFGYKTLTVSTRNNLDALITEDIL